MEPEKTNGSIQDQSEKTPKDPEQQSLEEAIFRENVFKRYDDALLGRLSFQDAVFEALDQAVLELFSKRGFRELQGVDQSDVRVTALAWLSRYLPQLGAIGPPGKRRKCVVGRVVEAVAIAALIEQQKAGNRGQGTGDRAPPQRVAESPTEKLQAGAAASGP